MLCPSGRIDQTTNTTSRTMQRSHESNCASILKTRSVQQKEEIKLQTQRQRNDVIKGTVLDFSRACFVQQKEEIKLTTQRQGQSMLRSHSRHCASHLKSMFCPAEKKRSAYKHNVGDKQRSHQRHQPTQNTFYPAPVTYQPKYLKPRTLLEKAYLISY